VASASSNYDDVRLVDDYDENEFARNLRAASGPRCLRRSASSAASKRPKSKKREGSPTRARVEPAQCVITLVYLGSSVNIPFDTQVFSRKNRITIYQQHCGGENLMVYSGLHEPGGIYRFHSSTPLFKV
jgi:hypothetical protein